MSARETLVIRRATPMERPEHTISAAVVEAVSKDTFPIRSSSASRVLAKVHDPARPTLRTLLHFWLRALETRRHIRKGSSIWELFYHCVVDFGVSVGVFWFYPQLAS